MRVSRLVAVVGTALGAVVPRLIGPFVRYELIEDRNAKVMNRDLIGTPEFFLLGLSSRLQLGWASTSRTCKW